jgi:hypothetical protein
MGSAEYFVELGLFDLEKLSNGAALVAIHAHGILEVTGSGRQ